MNDQPHRDVEKDAEHWKFRARQEALEWEDLPGMGGRLALEDDLQALRYACGVPLGSTDYPQRVDVLAPFYAELQQAKGYKRRLASFVGRLSDFTHVNSHRVRAWLKSEHGLED